MALGNIRITATEVIIWTGVILGILDWITDIVYAALKDFDSVGTQSACITFTIMQPAMYLFIYVVHIGSSDIDSFENPQERKGLMVYALPYTILQQFKAMGGFEDCNDFIYAKFKRRDQFLLFNLENSYRVQLLIEFIFQTFPQIVIQSKNNNETEWTKIAVLSFTFSILVLIKDITILTLFIIRKYFENRDNVSVRPRSYSTTQNVPKLDKDSLAAMKAYLMEPNKEIIDAQGNNELHTVVLAMNDEELLAKTKLIPHQLFMLNKRGQLPLDICIESDAFSNMDSTKDLEQQLSHRPMEAIEFQRKQSQKKNTGKIFDEAQTMNATKEMTDDQKKERSRQQQMFDMTQLLIKAMHNYHYNCSIRFLKQPHRLDLKFERSFTMAIKKNRTQLIASFPRKTIKTVFVSLSQLENMREFRYKKKVDPQDVITTPLHLACQMSNVEAARVLLTDHNYNVNILLYEKNFMYDLLNTSGFEDFSILSNIFKKRKPCINAGSKMPLNQAIIRGNQYIIQTMLEHGNPNPYASDINGITPLHVACAKLDWETFEDLIKIGGDPLLPDHDGNTFLHLLCEGGIKDVEYDFAKMACQQFNIRLTRNKAGRTPLNILKGMMTSKSVHVRGGQPNYKRKLQENLEKILSNNLSFEDHESNNELHQSIIDGDFETFKDIVSKEGFIHTDMINVRNMDGKSPLFLMVEYNRKDMFDLFLDLKLYEYTDMYSKDSTEGCTALHIACKIENVHFAKSIFDIEGELCMVPNFLGRSPFYFACQKQNMEILDIFKDWKSKAIVVQDYIGENMLFVCAREGNVEMFHWFQGSNNFFRARGQQNYKGHTIEHAVCIEGKTQIVQEIKPKLNTPDYYGNLPVHYTIIKDDHEMVKKYFINPKAYFELRNFKFETIFHVAAKNNSLKSLKTMLGKGVFQEQLIKRDFKGDTPIHVAAKSGSWEILYYFLTASTPSFLELENDFGLTPIMLVDDKIEILKERMSEIVIKPVSMPDEEVKELKEKKLKINQKINKLMDIKMRLENFDEFINVDTWDKRFEIPLSVFLEVCIDPNLKIFLGFHTRTDLEEEESSEKFAREAAQSKMPLKQQQESSEEKLQVQQKKENVNDIELQ